MARYHFPEWTNKLTKWVLILVAAAPIYLIAMIAYGVSPQAIRIGYQPRQPLPYSHALHVGELGIDCRYCHDSVDRSSRAALPTAASCMNCHTGIRPDSINLRPLSAESIAWVRVYDLPDYVFFDHSAHVTRGVGCEACHGRVDRMEQVFQATSMTMQFCLVCHNAPAPFLRPPDQVTVMGYVAPAGLGARLLAARNINPPINCSTCHR
jgi:hypothetical protein